MCIRDRVAAAEQDIATLEKQKKALQGNVTVSYTHLDVYKRQALDIAKRTYVNVNIHQKENEDKLKALAQLPDSCAASVSYTHLHRL